MSGASVEFRHVSKRFAGGEGAAVEDLSPEQRTAVAEFLEEAGPGLMTGQTVLSVGSRSEVLGATVGSRNVSDLGVNDKRLDVMSSSNFVPPNWQTVLCREPHEH